ncbi:hypothetical protein [Thioalkalivibrio thiocyanodenitrificans]|uniref:hypothetical protein n=1 Tax=Thioalkalivibrio thiocyanodenitrificans TaxID=243063 RepID=UPI0012E9A452|nr:hypothetical protein [Thioalkalivibrio thiocyanodenitrificans]
MPDETQAKWHTIRVDAEVFEMLQRHAQPLVDTANDVLRRILLKMPSPPPPKGRKVTPRGDGESPLVDSATFVQFLLKDRFGDGFHQVSRYQFMFESDNQLVYCQNYNKEADLLWYRVNKKPRRDLASSGKQAWLCLTNPAERYAYIIPMADVEARAQAYGWSRDEFEIHIHSQDSRWNELGWSIGQYKHDLSRAE